jgi:hypothetical protein
LPDGSKVVKAKFSALETVALMPNVALSNGAQFMDLAGDGQPDLVALEGPTPGLYVHDQAEGWEPFRAFTSRLNRDTNDPNLKFVDLDGDGHADVLITENEAFVWHESLAEEGFGPARRVVQSGDEEKGPRLVFADGTQSIHLADLSGDGLTDLVRIRNGEVCYWPNLGYGRFGSKVTMDNSPWFDHPDQFDQKRIRLADIDGSGTTDIIYLHRDGVRLYFNQSGNSWSQPHQLKVFPRIDDLAAIVPTDLLGNGTACLVWSSSLPGDAMRPMRYVNLMGNHKPHLLVRTINNLGAETRVEYAPSTKFYLQDKRDGKPWITKLPFPVHVVERVETYDHISRNRFVTRHTYHHGYFDGEEREFRGFGRVEQRDTEEFAALTGDGTLPVATNVDTASQVSPVLTKTWFHTGVYIGRDHISDFFAGLLDAEDKGEYYREPGLTDQEAAILGLGHEARRLYDDARAKDRLLEDTVLPWDLTLEEEREACRALKGAMLRQEIYALDGTPKEEHPYTVAEQNFSVKLEQPRGENRHAVFFSHPREAITYHYERNPVDSRIQHALTLEVDPFGNVLKSAAIGYGRRMDAPDRVLLPRDHEKQRLIHITCTENEFTNAILNEADVYRTRLPAQSHTYELRKAQQEKSGNGLTKLYRFEDILGHINQMGDGAHDIDYDDIGFAKAKQSVVNDASESDKYFRRLIEQVRTLYRPNDLGAAQNDPQSLLPLKTIESKALPGESYELAFTSGLLDQVYVRGGQRLLPANPANVLTGGGADRGGYVNLDNNNRWWIPSGRMFHSPDSAHTAAQELAYAQSHFFLPHRFRDPFGNETTVAYDSNESDLSRNHNLLVVETRDPLGNVVTVETKDDNGQTEIRNDYRVLQPYWVTDPNGNRTRVAFDTLGMVVGTAVMGKPGQNQGDILDSSFVADLKPADIQGFAKDPRGQAAALLKTATTRIMYDLDRFKRCSQPPFAATLARETHFHDSGGAETKIQVSFSYISAWKDNPFNPHLVARYRIRSYMWAVIIKYAQNHLAWADQLYQRDTIESINQATQLYVLVARLLGPRPQSAPGHATVAHTYAYLAGPLMDELSNVWRQWETIAPAQSPSGEWIARDPTPVEVLPSTGSEGGDPTPIEMAPPPTPAPPPSAVAGLHSIASLYFCIPDNANLVALWDTVEDRLFKVRHCMNIDGVERTLPLFEPPIDPGLLVRAVAAGLDIADVLAGLGAPLPLHRLASCCPRRWRCAATCARWERRRSRRSRSAMRKSWPCSATTTKSCCSS